MITSASSAGISGLLQLFTAWLVVSALKVSITIVPSWTTASASETMDHSSPFWLSQPCTCLHRSILLLLRGLRRSVSVRKMTVKNTPNWKCAILMPKVLQWVFYVPSFLYLPSFSPYQSYGRLFNNSAQFVNLEKHKKNTKTSSLFSTIHQITDQPCLIKKTMRPAFEAQYYLVFEKALQDVKNRYLLWSLVKSYQRVTLDLRLELISWLIYIRLELMLHLLLKLKVLVVEYQKLRLMELQGFKASTLLYLI